MINPYLIGGIAVAFVLSTGGAYLIGNVKGKSQAEVKIAQYQAEAEKKINDLNVKVKVAEGKIVVQYVDKVRKVKEKEYVYIDTSKKNVPSQFDVSNGWVYLHDTSAKGSDADRARSSDETSSGVRDNQALSVVVSNYSRCRENAEQLRALQTWISETKKVVESSDDGR